MKLTIEEAVLTGIENSIQLDQIEKQIQLSDVSNQRARYSAKKLRKGRDDIREGQRQLNEAEKLLDSGIAPSEVTLPDGSKLPAGTNLNNLPADQKAAIEKGIKDSLEKSRSQLTSGDYKIVNALQEAGSTISSALDFASLDALEVDSTSDVMETMTKIALEVTQASFDIYKNGIALLIQKNYYDVLQAKQLLEVKQKAMDRGKTQYEFAKASYEEGLKPKDDMLVASTYYRSTKIQYEQAKGDLENAIVELKKSINIGFDKDIELTDVLLEEPEKFDV